MGCAGGNDLCCCFSNAKGQHERRRRRRKAHAFAKEKRATHNKSDERKKRNTHQHAHAQKRDRFSARVWYNTPQHKPLKTRNCFFFLVVCVGHIIFLVSLDSIFLFFPFCLLFIFIIIIIALFSSLHSSIVFLLLSRKKVRE